MPRCDDDVKTLPIFFILYFSPNLFAISRYYYFTKSKTYIAYSQIHETTMCFDILTFNPKYLNSILLQYCHLFTQTSSSVISVALLNVLCSFVRQLCICESINLITWSEWFVLPVTTVNVEEQNDSTQAVAGHIRAFKHACQASCSVFPSGNLKYVSTEISDTE